MSHGYPPTPKPHSQSLSSGQVTCPHGRCVCTQKEPCSRIPTVLTPLGHKSQGEASPPPGSSSSTRKTRSTHTAALGESLCPTLQVVCVAPRAQGRCQVVYPEGEPVSRDTGGLGRSGPAGSETHPWEGMVDGPPRGSPEQNRGWTTGGKASTPGSARGRERRAHGAAPSVQVLLQSQQQPPECCHPLRDRKGVQAPEPSR